jgi:hypothetical protein
VHWGSVGSAGGVVLTERDMDGATARRSDALRNSEEDDPRNKEEAREAAIVPETSKLAGRRGLNVM